MFAKTLPTALFALILAGTPLVAGQYEKPAAKDIVQTAADAGSFETLLTAAKAAGLADFLADEGPITVFAPTDAAFAALPAGTLDSLLADPAKLAEVLKYHVVSGSVMASDVVKLDSATTLGGGTLDITTDDSGVMVNDARVVTTDIAASNGVIHVIDAVLVPAS